MMRLVYNIFKKKITTAFIDNSKVPQTDFQIFFSFNKLFSGHSDMHYKMYLSPLQYPIHQLQINPKTLDPQLLTMFADITAFPLI